jgi:hypothetical protein
MTHGMKKAPREYKNLPGAFVWVPSRKSISSFVPQVNLLVAFQTRGLSKNPICDMIENLSHIPNSVESY